MGYVFGLVVGAFAFWIGNLMGSLGIDLIFFVLCIIPFAILASLINIVIENYFNQWKNGND